MDIQTIYKRYRKSIQTIYIPTLGGYYLPDLQDFARHAGKRTKKGSHVHDSLKKIGGDLLFHKQVQYHRRCEA